ncbi:MAG: DNA-processing protein DprA [Candidatus Nomurabacteria bacterium]|jgi:DNA protecting protein DprA|nr:DNA-processing protein DprA [Candidatus Nomurabacteria bacterium]
MTIKRLTKSENQFLDHFPEETAFFVRGKLPEKRVLTVAIVGSRKPTKYGEETAYSVAYELARQGVVVISGLAIGVDAAAHRGALDAGGTTMAVLASGVDKITPWANTTLGERILASDSAIISEYPNGTQAFASNLLARNRVVSGLADAVIIAEAAAKSGTLATARHAMRQGRPIFVVPGRLTDKMSAGCLLLLEKYPEKVHIFTSANSLLSSLPALHFSADIGEGISPLAPRDARSNSPHSRPQNASASREERNSRGVKAAHILPKNARASHQVQDLIRSGANSTEITEQLGISASELAIIQTELELFG